MEQQVERITILWKRYLSNSATLQEVDELFQYLESASTVEQQYLSAALAEEGLTNIDHVEREVPDWMLQQILQGSRAPERAVSTIHRVHFLSTAWFRYAAAVIFVLGAAAYFWSSNKKTEQTLVNGNEHLQVDIAPGGERATLTLADGRTIVLDSASDGQLAQQGNAQVVKLANGEIMYNVKGVSEKEIMWNTMSTPVGGQYHVTLPDGTKVWLNASSSVTYPAVFVGAKRSVKVTGEVYFEVAKNKQRPFIVDIDGKSLVEVLGTRFNINSYKNEANIRTTLLEGSVKVSYSNNQAILKPGQQATIAVAMSSDGQPGNTADIIVKSDADLVQALAWKNGIFDFTGADLKAVMRQLERWYDIKVQYKGSISNEVFEGKLYRNVNLSDVLKTFKKLGVQFELDGKNLIIL